MTLTTERLREIASSPSFSANPLSHEVKYMARELLANREAQPVVWVMSDDLVDEKIISTPAYPNRSEAEDRTIGELTPLFTAPPAPAIPDLGSSVVNDAAWKLHDTLTEHGPLNGHQFNNLKGCLYEALKIVMSAPPAPAYPAPKDKSQGWKIDPEYLHSIADAVGSSDDEGTPSMELVEAVLLAAVPPAPAGEVVVTRNERGDIVAVTRQDGEGRVIEVIAESNAPPAPAVPDALANDIDSDDHPLLWSYNNGWNACRAAMLAQPVSQGYKLPEGWKLVPVEPTAEMINAALASGALSIRTVYRLMLAAAPGGGNDHDTRR